MSDKIETDPDKQMTSGQKSAEERRARQAAALRDNLHRRKQQARKLSGDDRSGKKEPK